MFAPSGAVWTTASNAHLKPNQRHCHICGISKAFAPSVCRSGIRWVKRGFRLIPALSCPTMSRRGSIISPITYIGVTTKNSLQLPIIPALISSTFYGGDFRNSFSVNGGPRLSFALWQAGAITKLWGPRGLFMWGLGWTLP